MVRLFVHLCLLLISSQVLAQNIFSNEIIAYREQRKLTLSKLNYSPLKTKEALDRLQYFPPDSSFRVITTVELTPKAAPIELAYAIEGVPKPKMKPYAVLSFVIKGTPCRLTAYQDIPKKGEKLQRELTVLFKDATSGKETYGGGRSLIFATSDIKEGKIALDFNKAHNSWCAYDPSFFCLIPPKTNWLPVAIEAGEKVYKEAH